jgi:hypothetical protein
MNLDQLNKWLTLLANFGVIGGLIFLALEIQQNTIAVQAGAIQESTNVARQQLLTYATDPALIQLIMTPDDELTDIQRGQLAASARSFWIGMQGLHRQWTMGVLPDDEWQMWYRVICANFAAARDWPREAEILIPAFVARVEACQDEVDIGLVGVPM